MPIETCHHMMSHAIVIHSKSMRHWCRSQARPHGNFLGGGTCLYTCPPPQKYNFLGGGPRKPPPPPEKLPRRAPSPHHPCDHAFSLRKSHGMNRADEIYWKTSGIHWKIHQSHGKTNDIHWKTNEIHWETKEIHCETNEIHGKTAEIHGKTNEHHWKPMRFMEN